MEPSSICTRSTIHVGTNPSCPMQEGYTKGGLPLRVEGQVANVVANSCSFAAAAVFLHGRPNLRASRIVVKAGDHAATSDLIMAGAVSIEEIVV